MKKLLTLLLIIIGAVSMNLEAGSRRRAPKTQVTVSAQVAVHKPARRVVVKRPRPVRVVRVVERVVPVRTVRVVERCVPVRRVCCRPRLNVGFGFGGPRCGFSFGVGF